MPNKIIVAVHGIGDQVRCETIQLVAYQFFRYFQQPAGLSLGALFTEMFQLPGGPPPAGMYLVHSPPLNGIGFAEVYWADIPRGPAKERYTLEESKKWAKTVVERIRAGDDQQQKCRPDKDYQLAAQVIEELIEGIRSIERLLYLAQKMNVLSFDLDQLLVDYLGDVQIVAEFGNFRRRILAGFQEVMSRIYENPENRDAELYIIAHSEGTVIAFLGILQALRGEVVDKLPDQADAPKTDWVKQLRGFMTIGSPLNKHLFLWPELFKDRATPPQQEPQHKIQWRNYYDLGDPIGFQLNQMRQWLHATHWDPFFEFKGPRGDEETKDPKEPTDDFGFTRYWWPGKAHNDYWTDEGVFGHFINTVVQPAGVPKNPGDAAGTAVPPPGSWWGPKWFSPLVPYALILSLLILGVYILYKTVTSVTLLLPESEGETLRNVLALSFVLAGITAACRIPRLTKKPQWHRGGYLVLLASLLAFPFLLTCSAKARLGSPVLALLGIDHPVLQFCDGVAKQIPLLPDCQENEVPQGPVLLILLLALVVVVVVTVLSRMYPLWGVKPLIFCGVAAVFGLVVIRLTTYPEFLKHQNYVAHAVLYKTRVSEQSLEKVSFRLHNLYLRERKWLPEENRWQSFPSFVWHKKQGQKFLQDWQPKLPLRPRDVNAEAEALDTAGALSGPPLWPLLPAGVAFLYLWWVASLAFDLAVVWQHYVRRAAIVSRLKELDPNLTRAK